MSASRTADRSSDSEQKRTRRDKGLYKQPDSKCWGYAISQRVAVPHLFGRDGDVVATVGWDRLSLSQGVTSPEELDLDAVFT